MREPIATKAKILKQSGQLFNTQGYKATSLSDITKATKLTKGAIYRHFKSKEHLEKEALLFLSTTVFTGLKERIKEQSTAPKKIRALISYFETYLKNPPVKGGCPLLNVSIESDDANPALRKQGVIILNILQESIVTMLQNGIKHGQLKKDLEPAYYASVIIGVLEGAIMMSKLRGNDFDMRFATRHLEQILREIEI